MTESSIELGHARRTTRRRIGRKCVIFVCTFLPLLWIWPFLNIVQGPRGGEGPFIAHMWLTLLSTAVSSVCELTLIVFLLLGERSLLAFVGLVLNLIPAYFWSVVANGPPRWL